MGAFSIFSSRKYYFNTPDLLIYTHRSSHVFIHNLRLGTLSFTGRGLLNTGKVVAVARTVSYEGCGRRSGQGFAGRGKAQVKCMSRVAASEGGFE